jgi:hypothetical protein
MHTSRTRNLIAGLSVAVLSLATARAAERDIFPNNPDAKPEIREALAKAKAEHKRVATATRSTSTSTRRPMTSC